MRMFVSAGVFVGAMLAAACADELAEGAGEMLVDAGEFLVDAGSDSAAAQGDGGAQKSETFEVACDKTWTRTTQQRANGAGAGVTEPFLQFVTTHYYAEIDVSEVDGVDAWTCDFESGVTSTIADLPGFPEFPPSCADTSRLECLESEKDKPPVHCQVALAQSYQSKLRVSCGSETRKIWLNERGLPSNGMVVKAERWKTARFVVRASR